MGKRGRPAGATARSLTKEMRSSRRELRWESEGARRRWRRSGRESQWAGRAPPADSRSPRPAGLVSAGAAEARLRGGRWSSCSRGLTAEQRRRRWAGGRSAWCFLGRGRRSCSPGCRFEERISRPPFLAEQPLACYRPGRPRERRAGRAFPGSDNRCGGPAGKRPLSLIRGESGGLPERESLPGKGAPRLPRRTRQGLWKAAAAGLARAFPLWTAWFPHLVLNVPFV